MRSTGFQAREKTEYKCTVLKVVLKVVLGWHWSLWERLKVRIKEEYQLSLAHVDQFLLLKYCACR